MDESSRYDAWIKCFSARHDGKLLGKCIEGTKEMAEAFPELIIVRGHVHDALWGKRGHMWLKTASGQVVDPTRTQFPALMEYEPWKPGDEVRVGRCMNCGEDIYEAVQSLDVDPGQKCICSKECERQLEAYLNS